MHRGHIKRVTVVLPDDVHIELKVHCAKCQKTLNDFFVEAIKMYLNQKIIPANVAPNSASLND